jgi:hypothetical protein
MTMILTTVLAALHDDTVTQQIEGRPDLGELQRQCLDFQHIYAYLDASLTTNILVLELRTPV